MKRLLSLMVAVVSVFMVGFTTVKAVEAPKNVNVYGDDSRTWFGKKGDDRWSTVKTTTIGGKTYYAFCLDSGKLLYSGTMTLDTSLYANKNQAVSRIVNKAIQLGLGTGSNKWGLTDTQLYGVTQTVVWKTVHGTGTDGYTSEFQKWISDNKYQEVFNTLEAAVNEGTYTPSLDITGNDGMKEEGKYLVSNEFTISSNVTGLTLTVNGGEVSVNGSWSKGNVTVKNGDVIKVRVVKPSDESGSVSVKVSVKSGDITSYNTYFYGKAPAGSQNLGVVIPTTTNLSSDITVTGKYTNKKKNTTLKVSKTDATNQKEVPGAHLRIVDLNDKEIVSWVSTDKVTEIGSDKVKVGVMYKLIEDVAPEGYVAVHNEFAFVLNADGTVTTCDLSKNDKECVEMSKEDILNITNEPTKLNVSKTDATGQEELDGAEMKVYEVGKDQPFDSWTSKKGVQHKIEKLVIGKIYRLEEVSSPVGYDKLTVNIYFRLDENGKTELCSVKNDDVNTAVCGSNKTVGQDGATYAEMNGEILVIKNYPSKTTKLVISKRDFATDEEIEGAHLQILDENGNIVAEWDSTKEPHMIDTLAPGVYYLVETLPSSNYNPEMIILGNPTSKYRFEIVEGETTKIDVYNKLIGVPKTGINAASIYTLGGLVMLIGAGTVVIAKRKENI